MWLESTPHGVLVEPIVVPLHEPATRFSSGAIPGT
jgi:hypothetical protein